MKDETKTDLSLYTKFFGQEGGKNEKEYVQGITYSQFEPELRERESQSVA